MLILTLPYPLSANKYWQPVHVGNHISIVPTKDAKKFRELIGWKAKAQGARTPIKGRVAVDVKLYPHRPLDFKKRMREFGDAWDDTVTCIDLDNANKVLLDALKGVAIEDDKWVRSLTAERMEPDGEARVIVTIRPYIRIEQPQAALELS